METTSEREVVHDVPPWIKVYSDGTIVRLVGYEVVPPGFDSQTGVTSKDVLISPDTGVSTRIYRPSTATGKLPLLIYFHGGAFCVATTAEPKYHNSLNNLVAEANIVAVSVDYRLAPEHPLPAAYDDSWAAIQWVAAHATASGGVVGAATQDDWIKDGVDFDRVFIGGDSAGSTIAHHIATRVGSINQEDIGVKIKGMVMIHPYFWGKEPIGGEVGNPFVKSVVDKWWEFVCTSDKGLDDPFINPFADGAPGVSGLGCERVIICVAEKDILRDRGVNYYEKLSKSKWGGKVEIVEVEGEDHVFHIFDPNGEKAVNMIKALAAFIKQE